MKNTNYEASCYAVVTEHTPFMSRCSPQNFLSKYLQPYGPPTEQEIKFHTHWVQYHFIGFQSVIF